MLFTNAGILRDIKMVTGGGSEGMRDGSWHELVAGIQYRMKKRCWKRAVMITLSNSEKTLHASELTLKRANTVNLGNFTTIKAFLTQKTEISQKHTRYGHKQLVSKGVFCEVGILPWESGPSVFDALGSISSLRDKEISTGAQQHSFRWNQRLPEGDKHASRLPSPPVRPLYLHPQTSLPSIDGDELRPDGPHNTSRMLFQCRLSQSW